MKSAINFLLSGILAAAINEIVKEELAIETGTDGSTEAIQVEFHQVDVTEVISEGSAATEIPGVTETVTTPEGMISVLWIIVGSAAAIALCIIIYFVFIYCARKNIVEPSIEMNRKSKTYSVISGLIPDE